MRLQILTRKVLTMRKFLAALLAVMMLASLLTVLPVSAATAPTTVDGSTPTQAPNELIVTEVVWNSYCFEWQMSSYDEVTEQTTFKDVFDYIEVYNASSNPICLYDYGLLYSDQHKLSVEGHTFTVSMPIKENAYEGTTVTTITHQIENPDRAGATLAPGEIGIIWVWTADTVTASSRCTINSQKNALGLRGPIKGDTAGSASEVCFPKFREHYLQATKDTYNVNQPVSTDAATNMEHVKNLKIVAVYATGTGRASLGLSETLWALTDNQSYDTTQPTIDYVSGALNDDILCVFGNGYNTPAGTQPPDGTANIYVPANTVPEYYNQNMYLNEWKAPLAAGQTEYEYKTLYTQDANFNSTVVNDYVANSYVESYKQMAQIQYTRVPTMGSMPSWQWAYVAPNNINNALANHWVTDAATISTNGTTANPNWESAAKAALVGSIIKMEEVDDSEKAFDYSNFITKAQNDEFVEGLGDAGDTAGAKKTRKDGGLSTGALIGIIAAAVVVVAGGVVLTILLLKKKKKGSAEEDIVIEGDVLETDAPSEEAAVEADAPAEENKDAE